MYLAWRQRGGEGITLCVHNWHCVDLVNKCHIIDEGCLFLDGIEGSSPSPLTFASLSTPVSKADVRPRHHTDAHNHHQYAETDSQCDAIVVSMDY